MDMLLNKLYRDGHKVLIFTQFTMLLDIFEEYCHYRQYTYCRLDGNTNHYERMKSIDRFQDPDQNVFIFLLSTKAGGLGINLTAADTVII